VNNAPSSTDKKAAEEADRRHRAAAAAEAARIEAERLQREKREQVQRDRDDALRSMKGTTSSNLAIKGAGTVKDNNSNSFGLKGTGNTHLSDIKPDNDSRPLGGKLADWKRLNYAFAITKKMATRMSGKGLKNLDDNDLAEISYLGTEAIRALHGERLGITVEIGSPPNMADAKGLCVAYCKGEIDQAVVTSEVNLQTIVRAANQLIDIHKQARELPAKPAASIPPARLPSTPSATPQKPASVPKSADDQLIAEAYAQQKAWQAKDEAEIKEVAKEQQENDDAMQKAMAAMFATQRALNQQNSAPPIPKKATP
jgi:hypothetical protein